MFLSKGLDRFPTESIYWKKGDKFHDKEIIVEKGEFKEESEIVDTYHLMVYGSEISKFSLFLANNYSNIRRLKY